MNPELKKLTRDIFGIIVQIFCLVVIIYLEFYKTTEVTIKDLALIIFCCFAYIVEEIGLHTRKQI